MVRCHGRKSKAGLYPLGSTRNERCGGHATVFPEGIWLRDFPIGSLESRVVARTRLARLIENRKLIRMISSIPGRGQVPRLFWRNGRSRTTIRSVSRSTFRTFGSSRGRPFPSVQTARHRSKKQASISAWSDSKRTAWTGMTPKWRNTAKGIAP